MYNNLKKIVLILIFSTSSLFSQNINLTGTIKDSLNKPLEYVNVIAEHQGKLKSFSFTDEKGRYKLKLKDSLKYLITITHVGFKDVKFNYQLTENNIKNITLKEQTNLLDEVVIETPIIVKEDTIFYNTQKFINGKERKLKNILKKLPGLEVDRDGKIKFNGKVVEKIYVDGKSFFSGSTKLAVDNIPADAVKNVKILENHNDVDFLKKYNESGKVVMDVSLKEDKKKFIFGDIELGKGNKKFYKAHSNLFYYSPKTSVNSIFKINNIGEKTFTIKDYVGFHADKNSVFKGEFDFKMTGFEEFLENSDLLKTTRRFGAVNVSEAINPKLYFSSFVIYSGNTSEIKNVIKNQYPTFIEDRRVTTSNDKKMLFGNLYLKYQKSDEELFKFKTKFNWLDKNDFDRINSVITNKHNFITSDVFKKHKYISQQIEWHNEYSDKTTFSSLLDYKFDNAENPSFHNGTSTFFDPLIPLVSINDLANFHHKNTTQKQYLNSVFKSFSVVKPRNQIHTTIGNLYRDEFFITSANQQLPLFNNFDNKFDNKVNFTFHSIYGSIHHRLKYKKMKLKYGFYLERNHWNITQKSNYEKIKWNFLPQFDLKLKIHSTKLGLNYQLKTDFADITKTSDKLAINSYSSIFKGNPLIDNSLYHLIGLSYTRHSLFKGYSFWGKMSYRSDVKSYISPVHFNGFTNVASFQQINGAYHVLNTDLYYSKRFSNFNFTWQNFYTNSQKEQFINTSFTKVNQNSLTNDLSLKTMYKKFPTCVFGYKNSLNFYEVLKKETKFVFNSLYATITYDFLKSFNFNLDYSFTKTENFSTNNFQLCNTSLSYHNEDSPWIFKIYGNNLLNFKYKQQTTFSNILISDQKEFLMPRVFLFSLGYKL